MESQYVILFGSYARGDFNGFSDVDLIVVQNRRLDSVIRVDALPVLWQRPAIETCHEDES